jgi:hypothetical protein
MSSKEQKKLRKRKERDQKNLKAKLARQAKATAARQEETAEFRRLKRIKKLQKEMGDLNIWADDVFLKMDDKTLSQLEKNCNILKALEDEYKKEHAKKEALNKELEGAGQETLEDKLSFLHNKLVAQSKELSGQMAALDQPTAGMGGGTEEIAEVSVIKAPVADVELIKSDQPAEEEILTEG